MRESKEIFQEENMDEEKLKESLRLGKQFEELDGRRPRMFMVKMEDDGCGEERKMASTTFADSGWDVDVGPLLSPADSAQVAADNDVHFVVYVSSKGHRKKYAAELAQALTLLGRDDILIAVHGAPEEEKEFLFRYGIVAAFPAGSAWQDASLTMLRLLIAREQMENEDVEEFKY